MARIWQTATEQLEQRYALTVAPGNHIAPVDVAIAPSGDARIDAVLSGYKWDVTNITYSFYDGGSYYGSESSPSPVSAAVRESVRSFLSNVISPLVNLTFTEVPDSATSYGMMRYLCSRSAPYAYAYYPTGSRLAGDVVLNPSYDVASTDTNSFRNGIGSHGYTALIHETCHALGLKHPGNYNGGGTGEGPFLPLAEDNGDNSLMTYNFYSGSSAGSPMVYDVAALGYMYGAKTTTRASDTTYTFTATDLWAGSDGSSAGSASKRSKNTLWDGGGTDTVDLSKLPTAASGYRVDIGAGGWITRGDSYNGVRYNASTGSPTTFSPGTTYTATNYGTRLPLTGTTLENVIVSGSSDAIFVNAAANRISGYTSGTATGADVISGADQADTLDLTQFFEASVAKSQTGNDLVLNLGGTTGTVTVKDYYAVASASRIKILYKDATVYMSIAAASADKAEGTGGGTTAFTFTVTRTGELGVASSVAWAVTGSGANPADVNDFSGGVLPSGTVSFAAGESSKTITVNVSADSTIESDDGFTVSLSAPSGGLLGTATTAAGVIRNDDFPTLPVVVIAAASAEKVEGTGGGTTPFTFTVTRSGDLTIASSVAWAVTGSGANPANATDFAGSVLPSGTVSFAAGESSKTITVNVAADSAVEANEGFSVTLSSPTGVVIGTPASASGSIRNDDVPTISIGEARIAEGDSGTTTVTLVVTLSSAGVAPVTVSYATFDRTATVGGSDYGATSGTLTFAVGETSKTITIAVQGDTAFEQDETFGVRLSAATGATIAKAEGIVTIVNDDLRSRISIAATDAVKYEGGTGRTAFTFTVTRTGSLSGDVRIPWTVAGSGGRAADRFDFIGGALPTGTVWFAPGRQTATVTVNVLGDRVGEFDEEFTVTLRAPLGTGDVLVPGAGSATGRILNDDPGTPRGAPAVPPAGRAAAFAVANSAATPRPGAQAFAALGHAAGATSSLPAKRPEIAGYWRR